MPVPPPGSVLAPPPRAATSSLTSACLCPWWVAHHGKGGEEAVFSGQGLAVQGQAHLYLPDAQVGTDTAALVSLAAPHTLAQSNCKSSFLLRIFSCLLSCAALLVVFAAMTIASIRRAVVACIVVCSPCVSVN